MHALLALLLLAGPARAGEAGLARKTARLDAQVADRLAPCAAAADELACLDLALGELGTPSLRHKGQDLAPALPALDAGRARARQLRVQAATAAWEAQASAALAGLPGGEDAAALAALDGWLGSYGEGRLSVEGEVVLVGRELIDRVRARRDQLDLDLRTTVVASTLWDGGVVRSLDLPATPAPRLRRLSAKKNAITDDAAWFAEHGLVLPERLFGVRHHDWPRTDPPLPASTPEALHGLPLSRVLFAGEAPVAIYGDQLQGGDAPRTSPVVAVLSAEGEVVRAWDLAAWQQAPKVVEGDELFAEQELRWAQVQGGTLFLSTAHRTYAASSRGHTGYLAAFDVQTGDLLWRSRPLVANAWTFVLTGTHAIAGYGFTAEPDYLYVLSLADGRVLSRTPVPSGPDFLFRDGDRLLVRTYDHDLVFSLD